MAEWKEITVGQLKEEFGFTDAILIRPTGLETKVLVVNAGTKGFQVWIDEDKALRISMRVKPPAHSWIEQVPPTEGGA